MMLGSRIQFKPFYFPPIDDKLSSPFLHHKGHILVDVSADCLQVGCLLSLLLLRVVLRTSTICFMSLTITMYPPSSRRVATLYPRMSLPKVLVFGATFIAAGVFLHSITRLYSIRNPLHIISHYPGAAASPPTVSDALRTLFDQIRVPVDADSFTDPYGEEFPISEDGPWWTEPLKNRILIVDTDTRVPEGENELWHEGRMNWDTITTEDGTGVVSAGQMNHFLYGMLRLRNLFADCADLILLPYSSNPRL